METKFQTSFIPKKPIVQEKKISGGIGLFLLISFFVFFITVGISGWIYYEKSYLIKQIKSEQSYIEKNDSTIKNSSISIDSFVRLNSRIEISKELLQKHVSVLPLFSLLQEKTLKNVRLNSFVFSSLDKNNKGNIKVDVSGKALNWRTMAAQVDEFSKTDKNIILDSKISNLSLSSDSSVVFLYTAYIKSDFLSYIKTKKI